MKKNYFFTKVCLALLLENLFIISNLSAQNAADYWTDINFTAPLEIETLQEEQRDNILVTWLRYTSHEYNGKKIRVYAVYGRPVGAKDKIPGLLHIHGGTQTASLDDVIFFANRGYATLSFDWTGPTKQRSKSITTIFPTSVKETKNGPHMKNSKVWHVVIMARRGISLLCKQPEVDTKQLGVYGVSWGGFSTWLVNATEPRLKAAVAIYGIGTDLADEADGWRGQLLPIHYAHTQKSPIAFLSGSNDFFGRLPVIQEVFSNINTASRMSLTPNENHGLDALSKETGYRWLDHFLKNKPSLASAPQLSIEQRGENLVARAHAPQAKSCVLSFSYGDGTPFIRLYWNQREMSSIGNGLFEAIIPSMRPSETVHCLVHAIYPENYRLTTRLKTLPSSEFPTKSEFLDTTELLFTPTDGANSWYQSYPGGAVMFTPNERWFETGPSMTDGRLCLIGYRNENILSPFTAYLRAPSDPRRRPANEASGISIEFNASGMQAFTLRAFNKATPDDNILNTRPLVYHIPLQDKQGWTHVTIQNNDWRDQDNAALPELSTIRELGIIIQTEPGVFPELGEIRWVQNQ